MTSQTPEYQKGYARGKKSADDKLLAEVRALRHRVAELEQSQKEHFYLSCLDIVLRNCSGWSIAGEKIKDAAGYCRLAKVFTRHAIEAANSK